MLNPTISRKTEKIPEISFDAKKLFQVIYSTQKKEASGDNSPKIKVSSMLSKVSFFYEKIRNSVDYKEDHLIRRSMIERILKREIVIEGAIKKVDPQKIAKNLFTEMIRALALPNDKIPEKKIEETAWILEKFLKLKEAALENNNGDLNKKNDLVNWIISLASCEIEESLGGRIIYDAAARNIYNVLKETINLPENSPFEKDRKIQLYLSINRKLFKFDNNVIEFILFKYYNPDWNITKDERIKEIGKNINELREKIKFQREHPLKFQINKIVSDYAMFFTILIELISNDPQSAYLKLKSGFKGFSLEIKKFCEKKYEKTRLKLWGAAIRSIIYIFLTKSVLVFFLEKPLVEILDEEINNFTLIINISFPAFLIFFFVIITRLPGEENTKRIIAGIEELVLANKKPKQRLLKNPSKRSLASQLVFISFYTLTFILSFGAIILILDKINFNWVSTIIFLFFLTFASFFIIRILRPVNDLKVLQQKEGLLSFIADFFLMPIIATGKWLSEKFSRVNIFVFILDFIIEAPFKTLVNIAEEWGRYVRERKDEIS